MWTTLLSLDKDFCITTQIEMLRHLARRGYDVQLFALWSRRRYRGKVGFPVCAIPLREVPLISPFFSAVILFLFLPLFALLKKPRFIIADIGVLTIPILLWKPLLSRCLKTKVILDIRSTPVEVEGIRGALRAFFFNVSVLFAKKGFDGITIITELMREEISRKFHLDPRAVGVWTSGVSTELFDPARYADEASRLREDLGLVGKTVVLYHGLFSPKRGIIECIKGMAMVKCDGLVLLLLGDGPALPAIKKAILQDGLQEKVILHDPVAYEDVPKYIAMSDAGLVPPPYIPDWANQNALNLLEYLAMEKPVILTDIPANRSVVGEDKCAIYVSSADPVQFSNAFTYLYDHNETLREWGSGGRNIVREKYDWGTVAGHLEQYLRQCWLH